MRDLDRTRTHAVLVGVEKHDQGDGWDLAGPAADAVRFGGWLVKQGVPADQIATFLSPLDDWPGIDPRLPPSRPAKRSTLVDHFTRELPQVGGDLLWVVWGGHGAITQAEQRLLLCADARDDDWRNVNLDALLVTARSSVFAGFPRQIWLIDACQTFAQERLHKVSVPLETYPAGEPLHDNEQWVILAARPGAPAWNNNVSRTGAFSQAILDLLDCYHEGWPPDPAMLLTGARAQLDHRHELGLHPQAPTYLWFRTGSGDQGADGDQARPRSAGGPVSRTFPPRSPP